MHENTISFVPLVVVIGLAFLVPLVLSRLRIGFVPIVVGEIIGGIIVGQSGLGLVQENSVLEVLSVLGFAYLMFLSGLEIDFSGLASRRVRAGVSTLQRLVDNPFAFGGGLFLLTLVAAAAASFFLQAQGLISNIWIMALILSTTSLGVVVPVLKEQRLIGEEYGQSILIAGLIADFASILLLSVYVLLLSQGLTLEILLVLILFGAFVTVYRVAAFFQKHLPAERIFEELSSATSQIKLRGSFALALIFIALAESLGVENILGAFLAGVIVSFLAEGEGSILREKLDAIGYGFFIPIFFVMVGVNFDLPALLGSRSALLLVPVLIGLAYVVKLAPAALYRLKYTSREAFGIGILLCSHLSLEIAAATIGLELGIISEAVNSSIILVAIITSTVSPIVFNHLMPERAVERDRIIVIGSRKSAMLLARRLREHGLDAILICGNLDQHRQALAAGVPSICPDQWPEQTLKESREALRNVLREAEVEHARTLVAMEEYDQENLQIARMARRVFGLDHIIAWVRDPVLNSQFRRLGAQVVNPAYSTVLITEGMVLSPDAFSLTADIDETQEVRAIKLQNRELVGQHLDGLSLPGDVIVLMIERGGDILVPDRETALRANDTVTLVGTDSDLDSAARLFARDARRVSEPLGPNSSS